MAVNLMGFKKVKDLPAHKIPKPRSIYDPLLDEVHKTGGIYTLDTHDSKRACSLSATLYALIKRRGYDDLTTGVRDTTVYVMKRV